jgi:hypothetical protein
MIKVGDRVTILAGDEAGEWGIVRFIDSGVEYHVAIADGSDGERVFERDEIRKSYAK